MNAKKFKTIYYAAIVLSIIFGVSGQLLMKGVALQTIGDAAIWSALLQLFAALFVYSVGVLCWIFSLRNIRLSVAYSLSSLNYVGILLGSYYLFGEHISVARMAGVIFIFIGVILVVLKPSR